MASAATLASALRQELAERGFFHPESLDNYRWADTNCSLGFCRDDETVKCYRDEVYLPSDAAHVDMCIRRIRTTLERESSPGADTHVVEVIILPAAPVVGGWNVSYWWLERPKRA